MKKIFVWFFLMVPSSLQAAVVISSKTYNYIWNPFTGTQQYVTSIDTTSVQGGSNVTISTTPSGVSISDSGGGPLKPGDTSYIQNTLNPTISTQTFAVAQGLVKSTGDAIVPLTIKGNSATQSANMTEWYYNNTTLRSSINQFGQATFGGGTHVSTNHGLDVYDEIVGIPGPTNFTDIQLWKDTSPSKAVAIGLSVPGQAVGDDLVFSVYKLPESWTEGFRLKNDGSHIFQAAGPVYSGQAIFTATGTSSSTFPFEVRAADGTQLFRIWPNGGTGTDAELKSGKNIEITSAGTQVQLNANSGTTGATLLSANAGATSRWQYNYGTYSALSDMNADGTFTFSTAGGAGPVGSKAALDGNVAFFARRHSSTSTANIFEAQDENGVAVSSITAKGAFSIRPRTKAQLATDVPEAANLFYTCTDCTTDALVVSTGIVAGSFARATSRTTQIN